jgi:hypothetical protein
MKTTVQIPDALLEEAREVAAREGTTLRELVEAGLRHVIGERRKRRRKFVLRDASYTGNGLRPEYRDAGWERVRDAIYEGHGA